MEQRLTKEKTCPLLMIAKACRNHTETQPINPQCIGEACAWWRVNISYYGKVNGGNCAVLQMTFSND